ncbi:MAG: zinc-ribbon and DUF3426 domain-containing protein [Burkholderiaceae bacterium]|jgi:predicted Zn finger-like uncharacterized protein
MLATRCPWCETVFRLTKEQAAIRAGMTRCGVCSHTFNALDYLIRTSELGSGVERPMPSARHLFRMQPEEPEVPDPLPEPPVATEEEVQSDEIFETDRFEPQFSPKLDHPTAIEDSDLTEPGIGRRFEDRMGLGEGHLSEPSFLRSARGDEPASRESIYAWSLLSLVALLALVGQAAFVWRSEIVLRVPETRPAFEQVCVLLRCRIEPPADISMLSIESSELEAVPGRKDAMSFSALLHNRSTLPGRYPAIELTLTDAQDHTMIRRVLQSGEYLSSADRAKYVDGVAPESELPVKIVFEVAGGGVAGYRVALFYP